DARAATATIASATARRSETGNGNRATRPVRRTGGVNRTGRVDPAAERTAQKVTARIAATVRMGATGVVTLRRRATIRPATDLPIATTSVAGAMAAKVVTAKASSGSAARLVTAPAISASKAVAAVSRRSAITKRRSRRATSAPATTAKAARTTP